MKFPKILQTSVRCLLPIAAFLAPAASSAQTFRWDAQPGVAGLQDSAINGAGINPLDWNTTSNYWVNELGANTTWDNSGGAIAQVGTAVAGTAGLRDINVVGQINLSALQIYAPQAYRFVGSGRLNFQDGGFITLGDGSTAAGTQVALNADISGKDISIIVEGKADQFMNISGAKHWTGNLYVGGGVAPFFLQANGGETLNSLDHIHVFNGATLALAGTNQTYSPDISIAGIGPGSRGAIRISTTNMTLTGRITLDADAMISTQDSGGTPMTGYLTKGIGESAAGMSFTKSGTGELFIRGASNYRGETIVSPVGGTTNGGTLTLDFAQASPSDPLNPNSIPTSNLLYNGVAANKLRLIGSDAGTPSALKIIGKDGTDNSQTFSGLEVTNFTSIEAISGVGGTVTLNLGGITRTGSGSYLTITAPADGSIKASNNGFLGPWARYLGATSGWAGVSSGTVGAFTGDLGYVTGTNVSAISGYTQNSNLRIGGGSSGDVALAANTTRLNSITMSDPSTARTISMGANRTIQFTNGGGIQNTSAGKQLTVGSAPGVGTITAGTEAGAELYLANFSSDQSLVINANVANNAGGGVDVLSNGTGVVRLAGNNTYTGVTRIFSGVVQAASNTALGSTSGNTVISDGGVLELANNLTGLAENISVVGGGIGATGAIRNAGGLNRYTGLVTLTGTTRLGSDAGRLVLGTSPNANVIAGSGGLIFSGGADIEVSGRIATGANTLRKEGTGILYLSGHNTYTGNTAITTGAVRASHSSALGTSAGGVTISGTGVLELAGGITIADEALSTSAASASGVIRNVSGNNTYGGAITLTNNTRIQSDIGSLLTLDVPTGNTITSSNAGTSNRFLVFGGPGDIIVKDAITHGGTGAITLAKEGIGTLTLQGTTKLDGTTLTPAVNVTGGRLILDHSLSSSILSSGYKISMNGGVLEVRGGAQSSNVTLGEIEMVSNAGYSVLAVGANTTLNTGVWTRPGGHFLLADLSASGSRLIANAGATTGEGNLVIGSSSNASFIVKDANGYDFAAKKTVNGVEQITRLGATTALGTSGGSSTTATFLMPTAGGNEHNLTGTVTTSTLRIDTSSSAGTLNLGSSDLAINRAALLMDGDNDFTITGTGVVRGLVADAIFLYNYGKGTLNIEAKLDDGNGQVFLAGTGLIDWKSAANASGNMWFMGGVTVRVGENTIDYGTATTGVGSGQLRIGSGGILELGHSDLTRNITGGNGSVSFMNGDGGGFSAYGGDRIVDLQSGGARADLTWGSGNFLSNGEKLILGSPHANAVVDLKNNLNLNGGNQVFDVQSQNAAGIGGKISGNITDSTAGALGSLTKIGQGILTLAGNNSFKGYTTIAQGTLDVTGSLTDTSELTVFNGAKLQVRDGGTVRASAYSLLNGSEISLELGATSGTQLVAGQNFSLQGEIKLSIQLTAAAAEGTLFTILDGNGALAGNGRFVFGGTTLNEGDIFSVFSNNILQSFRISYLADGGADVAITAVPEPGTAMAVLTSVGLLLGVNRFRRRSNRPSFS